MGQKAICIHGQEATKVFYDEDKFQRKGALPKRIQNTLLGKNGVHSMDGADHKNRKAMFLNLMTPANIQRLMDLMAQQWEVYIAKWEKMDKIVLFTETQEILCRAMCAWTGVPLKEEEVKQRSKDFFKMIDAFGGVGPRHWRGKSARNRTNKWMKKIIKAVRKGQLSIPTESAAYVIAMHRDPGGKLLDTRIAAVELNNVIRPTIAISYYITFIALTLHEYPMYQQKLQDGEENYDEYFVHEVRRFFPFAPILGAIVRKDFDWQGYRFKKGSMTILDVFGNLHDEKLWERPLDFFPDRFKEWNRNAFDLIPQGGGLPQTGHRCPGEWLTIETMKVAVNYLARAITYKVPEQDLSFNLKRIPTYPKSGFIISEVRRTNTSTPVVKVPQCPFHEMLKE
jgi:fatty-acid peroxygenase